MTVNHLASNYKTLIAVPFMIVLFGIGMGLLPLAEGLDTATTLATLLVPILALIASDHLDTYQLFKSGVYKLAAVDFENKGINQALDVAEKSIRMYEDMLAKDTPPVTGKPIETRFADVEVDGRSKAPGG